MLPNFEYQLNKKNQSWTIWVNENHYNLRENDKEILKKEFDSAKEALREAEDLMKAKIQEGYFHIHCGESGQLYGVITDLENSNYVEATVAYYLNYLKKKGKNGYISTEIEFGIMGEADFEEFDIKDYINALPYFQKDTSEYRTKYAFESAFYFFSKAIHLYPHLIPLIEEYVHYAISLKHAIQLGDEGVAFAAPILALTMSNQKYVKDYIKFLYTNDMDHESFQAAQIYYVIKRWGTNQDTFPLIVARCCHSLRGQSGMNPNHFIDPQNQAQLDQFFQLCIQDIFKDDDELKRDYTNWSDEEMDEWAEDTLDFILSPLLKELKIDFDKVQMLQTLKTMDLNNPPKLSEIIKG